MITNSSQVFRSRNGQRSQDTKGMAEQRAAGGVSLASRSDRFVNSIQLMFCIQIRALETFDDYAACVKGMDHYPSLQAAYAGTSKAKDAHGVSKP